MAKFTINGGALKGRSILVPKTDPPIRPSMGKIREAFFNIWDCENCAFIDAFAGSGIVGIEALSHGASDVSWIEKNRAAYNALNNNLKLLKETGNTIYGNALKIDTWEKRIQITPEQNPIIWLDPPYKLTNEKPFISILEEINTLWPFARIAIEAKHINSENLIQWATKKERDTQFRQYGNSGLLLTKPIEQSLNDDDNQKEKE